MIHYSTKCAEWRRCKAKSSCPYEGVKSPEGQAAEEVLEARREERRARMVSLQPGYGERRREAQRAASRAYREKNKPDPYGLEAFFKYAQQRVKKEERRRREARGQS